MRAPASALLLASVSMLASVSVLATAWSRRWLKQEAMAGRTSRRVVRQQERSESAQCSKEQIRQLQRGEEVADGCRWPRERVERGFETEEVRLLFAMLDLAFRGVREEPLAWQSPELVQRQEGVVVDWRRDPLVPLRELASPDLEGGARERESSSARA